MARRNEQTRSAILEAAARHFARKGYKRTRIADVIRDAGITPSVFSTQFATKRQLFLESFGVFVHWMEVLIEPPLADEPDPVVHLLTRVNAYFGLQALSPDLLALARSEALQEDVETREAVKQAYRTIVAGPTADFAGLREARRTHRYPTSWSPTASSARSSTRPCASHGATSTRPRHHADAPLSVPGRGSRVHRTHDVAARLDGYRVP